MASKYFNREINVRDIRNKLQLSQEEFAAELGVSGRSIARWESGRMPPPVRVAKKMLALAGQSGDGTLSHSAPNKIVIEIKLTADSTLIELLQRLVGK